MQKANYVSLVFVLSLSPLSSFASPPLEDVSAGVNASAIDRSINPCDDFYQFACGNWEKNTALPSDRSRWTRSFNTIDEQNTATLNKVLVEFAKGKVPANQPSAKKLGDFYASCVNEKAIERTTSSNVKKALSEVSKLKTSTELPALVAKMHLMGSGVFFHFTPTADLKDPTIFIAEIDQGGYTLPDPTYYTEEAKEKYRTAFKAYIAKTFVLAGQKPEVAKAHAVQVYAVEEKLALNSLPPDQVQDPTLLYHPASASALSAKVRSFNWNQYYQGLGIKTPATINLTEDQFLTTLDSVFETTPLTDIKAYLEFKMLHLIAPSLGKEFTSNYFNFNKKTLFGQAAQKARWKECVETVSNSSMGEALGQAYVENAFTPEAKKRMDQLIDNLTKAFDANLKKLTWLDAPTRAAALLKLSLFTRKIGYPAKWADFKDLKLNQKSFLTNVLAANTFGSKKDYAKIGGKVDPNEWFMTPQTVNAYYDPSLNNINFPAGILQPPFFSAVVTDALNYGSIGMVIGHEMIHGFDTVGSKFDGHGVNVDWWSEAVKKQFEQKAECLEKQYSAFEPLPGLNVNGHLTVTENIADNGGLKIAYLAFKEATRGLPAPTPMPGFNMTPDQLFFLSNAQGWCTKISEAALRNQVSRDPHSPSRYRINAPMMNNPDFAAAFGCKAGSPMAPANRCPIW